MVVALTAGANAASQCGAWRMTAMGQTEKVIAGSREVGFALNSGLRQSHRHVSKVPNPEVVASFDHLVGAGQHRGREDEVEGLSNS